MARKTQVFTQLPWNGGLNTAVDPGVIPSTDLVQADNVVFSTSGARIKREGLDYFDLDIPTPIARNASTTTRRLIFGERLQTAINEFLVEGEKITISGNANYAGDYSISQVQTDNRSSFNFDDADVDVGADTITKTPGPTVHDFYTGLKVRLTTTGTLPGGLATSTDYYVIVTALDTIKLATSLANAQAGTAIDITSAAGGGTHTVDPVTITNNMIVYTVTASLTEVITGTTTESVSRNYNIIGVHDYWYLDSNVKTQRLIAVSDEPKIYEFIANGSRKEIARNTVTPATALSSPTKVNFLVASNTLIMSFDGTANTPKKYNPSVSAFWDDLGGSPPNFEFAQLHLGRVFANDKTDPDRLHYSPPGDIETWNGNGDSGALDVFPGDGDSQGLTALAKPFKSKFYISKRRKIIEIAGDAPENFRPVPVTEGHGMISHNGVVPVDHDDLYYVSDRGFHSLLATDTTGDFSSSFLSRKIQPTFNNFNPALREDIAGVYLSEINSVAFNTATSGASIKDHVYLYNIQEEAWYRWPDISPQSIATRIDSGPERKFLFGTNDGRIIQAQNGTFTDFGTSGPSYIVKTGAIYPGNDAQSLKMFKRFYLYFKPKGDFNFTVKYTIDNGMEQTLTFTQDVSGESLLGTTFILGTTLLGVQAKLAPFAKDIEGIGRGITFSIESSGTEQPIEIYGYGIEYELAGISQEVLT